MNPSLRKKPNHLPHPKAQATGNPGQLAHPEKVGGRRKQAVVHQKGVEARRRVENRAERSRGIMIGDYFLCR
jgi:hypothetical protein